MKRLFFLIMLILSGCADQSVDSKYIEPQYQSFYDDFIKEGSSRGVYLGGLPITIVRDDFLPSTATCNLTTKTVIINEYKIKEVINLTNSPEFKEYIIFNALAHCLLNKKERTSELVLSFECYADNYIYKKTNFLNEIFN